MLALASLLALLPLLSKAAPLESRAGSGIYLTLNGDSSKCLSVVDLYNPITDGTRVSIAPCGRIGSQNWEIALGNNPSVRLSGTNYCLDAGTNPNDSGVDLKIWTCYPGLQQQQWYYTDDNHIAITGGTTCMAVPGFVETAQCGGPDQVWISTINKTTPTATAPGAGAPTSTPSQGMFIKAASGQYKNQCLTVQGGAQPGDGARVAMSDCSTGGFDAQFNRNQYWQLAALGSTKIKLMGTNLCLDAGSNPANGVGSKVWTCYDGLPAQAWYVTGDQHIALEGNTQCLDIVADSVPQNTKPYGSLKDVQTWQCSGPDQNQLFSLVAAP